MKNFLLVVFVVIMFFILWYFVSPLFLNKEVNDTAPSISQGSYNIPDVVMSDDIPDVKKDFYILAQGEFRDADSSHKGSGTVLVYDGLLRFEDFTVTNGPDLRVLLVKHPNPQSVNDIEAGYVELAKLKGNIGNQNYDIPSDINWMDYSSVVIYCKPFRVIFSIASLR